MNKIMRGKNTFAYVPGARFIKNKDGTAEWKHAKPTGFTLHFRSAAAKARALRALAASVNPLPPLPGKLGPLLAYARPQDLVKVPLYQGLDARLANEWRGDVRREKLRSMWAKIKDAILVPKKAAA